MGSDPRHPVRGGGPSLLSALALNPTLSEPAMLTKLIFLLLLAGASGDELAERKRAAGDDVAKLYELALWCEAEERDEDARGLCERVLKLDPEHAGAHEKLRHHRYDGRWFETYRELSRYRAAEEERMGKEGLVRHAGGWAPAADVPYLRMGWTRAADGRFASPAALERERLAAERTAAGWQLQDLTWIPPEEFDSWRGGLYKCGAEWLAPAEADRWHAELGRWWQLPGEHFELWATTDRESARWALWWADQAYPDLVRALGAEPARKPVFVTLGSLAQYNDFAAGNVEAQRPAAEVSGWSSVHYAFQADSFVERSGAVPEYPGAGVCYWDVGDPALKPYGQHAVRHAAALSYLEALDPSWNAVSTMLAAGPGTPVDATAFWAEKKLPAWLRFGIASWCERYFRDAAAPAGADPWWARTWALENLRQQGGLRPLDVIFACALDATDPAGSGRLISEAGAVVSFALDGGCAPVTAAYERLRQALSGSGDVAAAARELEGSIREHDKELARYAAL
jgi:hypothetical protein